MALHLFSTSQLDAFLASSIPRPDPLEWRCQNTCFDTRVCTWPTLVAHTCNPRPWWPPLESFAISHRSFSKEIATFARRHRKHIRLEFCGCRGWRSSPVPHERTCSPTFVRVRRTSKALGRRKGARGGASAGKLGDQIVDRNKAEPAEIHVGCRPQNKCG